MFFDSLIMFLQMHQKLFDIIAIVLGFLFAILLSQIVTLLTSLRITKRDRFSIKILVGSLVIDFIVFVCLSYSLISGSNSQRIINSMSSWTAPVKVNKLITDEVNTAGDFDSAKVKYVLTDHHVYTLRHRNLISKRVVMTSKPTYVTYQHRVLKSNTTKFERQYFKTVQSGNVKTHGVQVKFGKLVNHKHVSSQQ